MPRKGEDRGKTSRERELDSSRELERAAREIAALSESERGRLYALVRGASAMPLSDAETERIATILWADRGEGIVASLEAGFKLFEVAEEEPPSPRRRRRRTIASLSARERRELLAALLAGRHVPPDPSDEGG